MMSELTQAMIVNAAVLGSVLATDLGPARVLGRMRILRPLIVAGAIVPLFVKGVATAGTGLAFEIAGSVLGMLLGLAAAGLVQVYRDGGSERVRTRAGWLYAALWTGVVGARAAFSYGCVHWFPNQLVRFGIAHNLTVTGLTDTLVFMAVAMLVTRTLAMAAKAARLAPAAEAAPAAAPANRVPAGRG
jgi:hypothetical protein